jgi:hypothetical protein
MRSASRANRTVNLDIIYVGVAGGTCEQRAQALGRLGHSIRRVHTSSGSGLAFGLLARAAERLGRVGDLAGANRAILAALSARPPDLLWIDKGRSIKPATLARVRERSPRTMIVAYSPDDQLNPTNQSADWLRTVPLYDFHVTTKSYNVQELADLGAREVIFVDNAYDPEAHRPLELDARDRERYGADAGFVGGFEPDRARQMLELAEAGIEVRVWGYGWDRSPIRHPRLCVRNELLEGLEYAKSINATKVNLGFLRKVNRDLQTTRTMEIPGCGGFLLAERTDEHLRLFREGEEAEFFGSTAELVAKCRHYLEHDELRRRIAAAGHRRCITSGYSNEGTLGPVIAEVERRLRRR